MIEIAEIYLGILKKKSEESLFYQKHLIANLLLRCDTKIAKKASESKNASPTFCFQLTL